MSVVEGGQFNKGSTTPIQSVLDALLWEVLVWCSYRADANDFETRLNNIVINKK